MTLEAADRRTWTGKRGSVVFIKPKPRIGVVVFAGRVTDDAAVAWHEHFGWLVAEQGTRLFFDGGELIHAGLRMSGIAVAMITRARARIDAAHVLVHNKYVEAMADAANLSFGGYMQMHRERASFEAELERALRG